MPKMDLKSLPEPGNKYKLGLKIGGGVGGEVYEAVENQTGKKVAIKIIDMKKETEDDIQQEYHVLKEMSGSENFPEFYGVYSKKGKDNGQKIWLVMEFCGGGDATSLVRKLIQENKKMSELHIAYILRETIKSVIRLRENDTSHRDIRGSNVLLTDDGRVKLVDYGISKRVEKTGKMKTCIGSPSWLAPEVILGQIEKESGGYDEKADVWAIGITAIELGDGQAPFEDTHPGRALFQIVNNPPPTLRRSSDWSQLYNDFVSECLVKNPENRPFVQELLLHPFFEPLDEQKQRLLQDLSVLLENYKSTNLYKKPDVQVRGEFLKIENRSTPEKILHEDLAAMTPVTEDSVLFELHERLKRNEFQTFVGDVLLILNPNKTSDVYGGQHHQKYRFKAKSQNAPHIYATAESAYRDVFHHEKPQHILFSGETGAGKTANMIHAVDHLLFLGQGLKTSEKVAEALEVIHAMGNAATPHNNNSTRHILQTQLTFTDTGKVSGAVFRVFLLEKERITMTSKKQSNFHLLHYFYDAIKSRNELPRFHLGEEEYNFLKTDTGKRSNAKNITQYKLFEDNLTDLGFEEGQLKSIGKILAAILLMGEIEFQDDDDGKGVLSTPETVKNVADLLGVDKKKLSWALLNYCLIVNGEAVMRHNSKQEADEGRNVLARGLYSRLVDWVVNAINEKISVSRVIYGDSHVISLLDLYGFECYKRNTLSQLFVNTINEQLQCQYNQKIFTWDKQTADEDGIPLPNLQFKDNKIVMDLIMSKPEGLLHKIDEATRNEDSSNLLKNIGKGKEAPIFVETSREFSINHYTGKITYDATDMPEKNRDFLPPEIIETMRLSTQEVTKQLFSSLLSRSGNLSRELGRRFGNEVPASNRKNVSNAPSGQFSQSRQMRTAATTFRDASADLFRNFADKEVGFHFVRCIRTDLTGSPGAFDPEVVRQQLRALAVVNTALNNQQGYSYSVLHGEFIKRYKFLAFDFDENVEETRENCRLLLLRLKLEGWTMGKTRVFLKYYNREYLSRLYEMQIKKIVKVQSMMRTFVARRKLYAKIKKYQVDAGKIKFITEANEPAMEATAARIIQKRFREYTSSKRGLTEAQKEFIKPWYKRWRTKSIFQVLLLYRAERLQTLVNFCLQIHLYNQNFLNGIRNTNRPVSFENVNSEATPAEFLPPLKPAIPKLLFLWRSLNARDDITNCEPLPEPDLDELETELRADLCKKTCLAVAAASPTAATEETGHKHYEDKEIQTNEEIPISTKFLITDSTTQDKNKSTEIIKDEMNEIPIQDPTPEVKKQQNVVQDLALADANNPQENPRTALTTDITSPSAKPKTDSKIDPKENPGTAITTDITSPSAKPKTDSKIDPKENPRTAITTDSTSPFAKPRRDSRKSLTRLRNFQTEMEEKFKNKNYTDNSDDPPFNFRSLLKKTNYTVGPRKSSYEDTTFQREIAEFSFPEKKKSLSCGKLNNVRSPPETIVAEIAPGIFIYGKMTDL